MYYLKITKDFPRRLQNLRNVTSNIYIFAASASCDSGLLEEYLDNRKMYYNISERKKKKKVLNFG